MTSFAELWQQAIDDDPYWQIQVLLEEGEVELANYLWDGQRIAVMVEKRLATTDKD